jgi:glycerophosphoryl diester phosphodiesterase
MNFLLILVPVTAVVTSANWFVNQAVPIVNCHAGCGGHYPAYSEAAIVDAFLNGADFIEVTL